MASAAASLLAVPNASDAQQFVPKANTKLIAVASDDEDELNQQKTETKSDNENVSDNENDTNNNNSVEADTIGIELQKLDTKQTKQKQSAKKPAGRQLKRQVTKEMIAQHKETFESERYKKLLHRYKTFKFRYENSHLIQLQSGSNDRDYASYLAQAKLFFNNFMHNYEQYWLNIYRPFDEYDMETGVLSHRILFGCRCCKPCLENADCANYCCMCVLSAEQKKRIKGIQKRSNNENDKCCSRKKMKRNNNNNNRAEGCCGDSHGCGLATLMIIIFCTVAGLSDLFGSQIREASDGINNVLPTNATSYYMACTQEFREYNEPTGIEYEYIKVNINGTNTTIAVPESSIEVENEVSLNIMDILFLTEASYSMDEYNISQMVCFVSAMFCFI